MLYRFARGIASAKPLRLLDVSARRFSAAVQFDRQQIIAEALRRNVDKRTEFETELMLEKDMPDVQIPHHLKIKPRDNIETRKMKLKQQFYYSHHQKYSYIDDIYVKKGWLSQELIDSRRAYVKAQMSKAAGAHGVPEISLDKLAAIQSQFEIPAELKINDGDSIEIKRTKALGQIQSYIERTSNAIDSFPKATEHLKELKDAHMKLSFAKDEDIEMFLLENESRLKEEETSYESLADFMKANTHRMLDVMEAQMKDPLHQQIQHKPLDMLGLIKSGSIDAIDDQLQLLTRLQKKRLEEYTLRYGAMPDDKELQAQWEAEVKRQSEYDAKALREDGEISAVEAKLDTSATKDPSKKVDPNVIPDPIFIPDKYKWDNIAEGLDYDEKAADLADIEADKMMWESNGAHPLFKKSMMGELTEEEADIFAAWQDSEEGKAFERKQEDEMNEMVNKMEVERTKKAEVDPKAEMAKKELMEEYKARQKEGFRVVTDENDENAFFQSRNANGEGGESFIIPQFPEGQGPAPPTPDLKKYQHLKNLPYEEFDEPPTEFETYIMDEFAREQQRAEAREKGVTLFPRIPVPNGPEEKSWVKKALLLYRIRAIRVHIDNLRKTRKQEEQRRYRDLDLLPHDIDDPANPWKLKLYDECKVRLSNQGLWTTKQKEDFLRLLHHSLTAKTTPKQNRYTLDMKNYNNKTGEN